MSRKSILSILLLTAATTYAAEPNLPRVELPGGNYYYYEVKKGDSLYGICRTFGWDQNEVIRLNPTATRDLRKGSRLYYPAPDSVKPAVDSKATPRGSVRHIVQRGETVYSLAKLYGISVDSIYNSNPSSRTGIKAGETLVIETGTGDGAPVFHVVRKGDTLYALAHEYRTTVEDILSLNPGVSESNFQAGSTVKINPGSNSDNIRTETVKEERVETFGEYKARKNDTWESVARKTGVAEDDLREANEGVARPEKNEIITVPVISTIEVEQQYIEEDPRSKTEDGIREIYREVNNIDKPLAGKMSKVTAALVLDKPDSKRDTEFSRGFLAGIDRIKNGDFKIDLHIMDGTRGESVVVEEIKRAAPDIIITTAEKDLPGYLTAYGDTTKVEVVNVFDVKSEHYINSPSLIQLLLPSNYFNNVVAKWITDSYGDRDIIFAGTPDPDDQIAQAVAEATSAGRSITLGADELAAYQPDDNMRYLIYAYPTRREDAERILAEIESFKERAPFAEVAVIGRPNWITFEGATAERMHSNDAMIPSRFHFDTTTARGKKFIADYTALFGTPPLKSYPVYSVSGYDVAGYFLPASAATGGDFNGDIPEYDALQTDFDIRRVSNWGGFINPICYVVRYTPFGTVEKIKLTLDEIK